MSLNVVLRRCLLFSSGSCDHRRSFSSCESPWIRHSASVRHFSLFITSSSSSSSSSSLLLLLLLSLLLLLVETYVLTNGLSPGATVCGHHMLCLKLWISRFRYCSSLKKIHKQKHLDSADFRQGKSGPDPKSGSGLTIRFISKTHWDFTVQKSISGEIFLKIQLVVLKCEVVNRERNRETDRQTGKWTHNLLGAIPERLRAVFSTRWYTNPRVPYPPWWR